MAKTLKANGISKCIGCFTCMLVCAGVNHQNHSITRSAIHIKSMGGMQNKFTAIVCLACKGERACMESCPSGALTKRKGGGVVFDKNFCIGCGKCKEACIAGAIHYDSDDSFPVVCKHCSMCAKYCPHKCLSMEETSDAE